MLSGFRGISQLSFHIDGPQQLRIEFHIIPIILPQIGNRHVGKFLHGMLLSDPDHKVLSLVLLKHQPHGLLIVPCVSPVTERIEILQSEVFRQTQLDSASM